MDSKITIEKAFCPPSECKLNIESNLKIIDENLKQLVENTLLEENCSSIYAIERKGRLLFSKYEFELNKIHRYNYLKLFNSNNTVTLYIEDFFSTLPVIILVDAIGSGNEIRNIIEILSQMNLAQITMVCGYLANNITLAKLIEDFPDIKFHFLDFAENNEEYTEKMNLLRIYFREMVEPIEMRPYNLYKINQDCEVDSLLKILDLSFKDLFLIDDLNISTQLSNEFGLEHIITRSSDVFDENTIKRFSGGLDKKISVYEKISIRCCYNSVKKQLSTCVYPHIHVKPIYFFWKSGCTDDKPLKICKQLHPTPNSKIQKNSICSECTHLNISLKILFLFNEILTKNGKEIIKERIH